MTLCSNRPEGFGPHSRIHSSIPTTCFLDVIVTPLATWIFLLLLPIPILAYYRSRRAAAGIASIKDDSKDDARSEVKSEARSGKPAKSVFARILAGFYYLLALAMLAMQSLEIARLVVGDLGVGLLPFTYVGVLLAALFHYLTTSFVSRAVSALYWIMLVAAMSLKVAALIMEEGKYNRRGVTNNYPLGDEVTDVSTMVGVEFVLAVLEFVAR